MTMPLALLLRRRLRSSASPLALFGFGEQGVWFDPSDVANLNWRRNLLTYTEQFDNAAWVKAAVTIVANADVAPNGLTTADRMVPTAVATFHDVRRSSITLSSLPASVCVLTAYVKASGYNFVEVGVASDTTFTSYSTTVINLTDGTNAGTGVNLNWTTNSVSVQNVGSGWYRVSLAFTPNLETSTAMVFTAPLPTSSRGVSYTGDGTSGVLIWGAQLELGSTATDYQRISDVNTEVIERFPTATLYQDTAGTTPVTTTGQSVGLMLDKSKGLVLGSELFSRTLNFADAGWTKQAAVTSSGQNTFTTNAQGGVFAAFLSPSTTLYRIRITGTTSATLVVRNASNLTNSASIPAGSFDITLNSQLFIADGSIFFQLQAAGTAVINSFSVKELPGNHAVQATAANRPIYGIHPFGGRRNLLTFTEQFDNAAWTKQVTTVSANTALAPDGTATADKLVPTAVSSAQKAVLQAAGVVTATAYTVSCYAKAGEYSGFYIRDGFSGFNVVFNLTTGAVTSTTSATGTITAVGDGWFRCAATMTSAGTAFRADLGVLQNGTQVPTTVYTADGTSGIFVWGAQLETGSTATAYQRVTDQYNVTEAGVSSVSYLFFDGVNDSMATSTITPGVDKAQVFAGVRKLSDAAAGIAVESSANSETTNGSIGLVVPGTTAKFVLISRGTAAHIASTTDTAYNAPITSVLTGLGDISGDRATLRVNGTQIAQSTNDQGTGNYTAQPTYIGARAGTSAFFSGHLYSLIVRFGPNLATGQISSTETWVAGKTGIVI
jgi:hypothetical protein